ncbi:MAG TPA: hypothetical protein PK855_08395 [Bacteroidales bacterium]|nr:hypothetical protein [Bacteroidales bacterium]
MKSGFFLKFLSSLMAVMVLAGASGITLNAHYCTTNHTLNKSILPFPIECNHAHEPSATAQCGTDTTACCHTGVADNKVESKGCCEDFLQYIKGITDFEMPTLKIKKVFNQFLVVTVRIIEFFSPSKSKDPAPSAFLTEDPPPLSGKTLTITYHQFKLDTLLG